MKKGSGERPLFVFLRGIVGGNGWAIGATIGFAFLIWVLSFVLNRLGGLPVIGDFFANLISITNEALESRKNLSR